MNKPSITLSCPECDVRNMIQLERKEYPWYVRLFLNPPEWGRESFCQGQCGHKFEVELDIDIKEI